MRIYFDMDGTIADLYGVENWLNDLRTERTTPYEIATPLCDLERATDLLNELKDLGYSVGIISWTSKGGSKEYNARVRKAKKEWLKREFPIQFEEIHIVKYGTRKDYVANEKNAIIFDDDNSVREFWINRGGIAFNPTEENIIEILEKIIEESVL